jgi:RNA polymerase sigma-70 factor (ECF subfamily)
MTTEGAALSRWMPWASDATAEDWGLLYAEQLPRIYNFFRFRVGDGAEAEDLTSITFEKAWRGRHRFRRDLAAFSTWLHAIARNVAIDHFRRARPHVPLEAAEDVASASDPENDAVRRSEFERLTRLLERLQDRERELIALKYGSGLTNRAIARVTGLGESNVGTILHRTIQELRRAWEEGDLR